jgi:hypothetical protein
MGDKVEREDTEQEETHKIESEGFDTDMRFLTAKP